MKLAVVQAQANNSSGFLSFQKRDHRCALIPLNADCSDN